MKRIEKASVSITVAAIVLLPAYGFAAPYGERHHEPKPSPVVHSTPYSSQEPVDTSHIIDLRNRVASVPLLVCASLKDDPAWDILCGNGPEN